MSLEPTKRFSSRVENYVRYRPSYPSPLLDGLVQIASLNVESKIADIGAGTGILTADLVERGFSTIAVEPNAEMRQACDRILADRTNYRSVDGTAESTTLLGGAVDLIVAAQAFHWFDQERAKFEFRRIGERHTWTALIWNTRLTSGTLFLDGYERILVDYAPEYGAVRSRYLEEREARQFLGPQMITESFPNVQTFDLDGVVGRLMSSSYAPEPGHPQHDPMLQAVRQLVEETSKEGSVEFQYRTELFMAQLG